MENVDYQKLYSLQDKVFSVVRGIESNFYLTGGTCLHRFRYNKRYSDDLDFFTSENNIYREDYRLVMDGLNSASIKSETIVDSKDFIRLLVEDRLKIDFVNDRVFRYGRSIISENGIKLDNIENILANKLCAVLSRDEPKDVFDICTIFILEKLDFPDIFNAGNKKCVLEKETLEFRLKSFPIQLFDMLPVIDTEFFNIMKISYTSIIGEIIDSIPV